MLLIDYLNATRGAQSALCVAIGAHSPDMSRWAAGQRSTPPDRCPAIERATGGRVTCEELRPDVRWQRVPDAAWPHAEGRPCIDVAAPAAAEQPQAA
jgi:DNA-binding transcriptional regulator YdaS (Cro superfamily)